MNDELERMWKETSIAFFSVLSWHLPEGVEENCVNLNQDSKCPGQDSK
jgi:hypothetical protein